ncbi:MAG: pantoate--beta-alanine ligase [Tannerella sp.]|jgi:pantoate--beta-alanine ligase|nr:pantoate--beta-alanine ligase [Tannerella sp.]
MKIEKNINQLKRFLETERRSGKSIGLIPTMGALHDGHLSLVRCSQADNQVSVVSIFVNPTQFNDRRDLLSYPRTPEIDCKLLESIGCDYVFIPSEEEMYPAPDTRVFDLGTVAARMEGAFRAGHFNGVAQIVSKLFEIVSPDRAYFGEKDYQQLAVVRELVRQLHLPVQIVACPTLREADGLAISSRNVRLTPSQRQIAPKIAATLEESRTITPETSVSETINFVIDKLNSEPAFRVEYFEIVDGLTLLPIERWDDSTMPVGCIAVFCGEVRLIDNIRYKQFR